MQIFEFDEANTHFARLVDTAAAGEEIVIAKAGKPVANLVPLQRPKRRLGLLGGRAVVPPDFARRSLKLSLVRSRAYECGFARHPRLDLGFDRARQT